MDKQTTSANGELPDFETICAHLGEDRTRYMGAVVPPIFQNSLFTYPNCEARETGVARMVRSPKAKRGNDTDDATQMSGAEFAASGTGETAEYYEYTRVANPTAEIVETKIAALERGERARVFGSGMGAISAAIMSCVKAGDHVIVPTSVYGPTRTFLETYLTRFHVSVTFVDGTDTQQWADALLPETTLLFLESPSSFVMKQQDLAAIAALARQHGAMTICDNSWASPYFQTPLALGVDLVVHSATKYLGGHSDVLAGVVVGDSERVHRITWNEGALFGATLDPFAAWLLLRGIRTLPVRMEQHQRNARKIAMLLHEHPKVAHVFYPGLPDDPQADLTARQLRGTSGLLSFTLKTPTKEATYRFINALEWFGIGCSWGGFESLAVPGMFPGESARRPDLELATLARLHIGLESADDLWADIEQALHGV